MELFSLILAVGMLVDDAIIVSEFAERRMAEGMLPREAYSLAAKRMAGPVTAATLTRVAAFSPLLFWPGVVGEFMKYMPITLIATLSASLVAALFFVPLYLVCVNVIKRGDLIAKEPAALPIPPTLHNIKAVLTRSDNLFVVSLTNSVIVTGLAFALLELSALFFVTLLIGERQTRAAPGEQARVGITGRMVALRAASASRRAARWTTLLTATATVTNSRRASRFFGSAIVKVCSGWVKYQFSSRLAATAANTAGQNPPTTVTATTATR